MATQTLTFFPAAPLAYWGYSVHKKPTFASIVQTPPSGREVTDRQQVYPLWEFNLTYEVLRDQSQNNTPFQATLGFTELQVLGGFWLSHNGQYASFLFDDPDDDSRTGQPIGIGDGVATSFPMVRTWGTGAYAFVEPVGIVDVSLTATLNIYLNGTPLAQAGNWWIDADLRTLVFTTAPSADVVITADFGYFFFCRFITDDIDLDEFFTGRWQLEELKFRSCFPDPPYLGNNYTIPNINTDLVTPQGVISLIYFQAQITQTGGSGFGGGGWSAMIGIADGGFDLLDPWHLNTVSPGGSDGTGGMLLRTTQDFVYQSWGYPAVLDPHGVYLLALGDYIGIAIDLVSKQMWIHDPVNFPNDWGGSGGSGTPNPETGAFGFIFSGGDGTGTDGKGVLTSPIYACAVMGKSPGKGPPELILNLTGPFVGTPPAGYSPWGTGGPNPADASPYITISGNTVSCIDIPGINQPTAGVRSTTSQILP